MPLKDLLFSFDGRIRRSQWWAVHLSMCAGFIALLALTASLEAALHVAESSRTGAAIGAAFGLFCLAAAPFMLWIGLATGVKRYHDQDLSGWMVLIALVPAIGWLLSLIFLGFIDGQPNSNRFGPSPKHRAAAAPAFS